MDHASTSTSPRSTSCPRALLTQVNPGLDPPPPAPRVHEETEGEHINGGADGPSMHGDHPSIKCSSPTVRLAVELVLSALGKQIC